MEAEASLLHTGPFFGSACPGHTLSSRAQGIYPLREELSAGVWSLRGSGFALHCGWMGAQAEPW